MGVKVFSPKGIDQKSNDLIRDPSALRDAQNIQYNENGEYVKRPGTEVDAAFSGDTYSDVVFIKSTGEYFFRNGSNYYSYKNGVKKTIPMSSVDPTSDATSLLSTAEYLNTLIFTHQNGQSGTYKYDGDSIYKAGLPVPTLSIVESGTTTAGYMLNFFDYIDAKGNQIFGPAKITPVTKDTQTVTVTTLKDSGFYEGYLILNTFTGYTNGANRYLVGNMTASERTITYTQKSADLKVGSKVVVRNTFYTNVYTNTPVVITDSYKTSTYFYVALEIESINTGTSQIVFKASSFNGHAITLTDGQSMLGQLALRSYFSTDEFTGYSTYSGLKAGIVDNYTATNSGTRFVIPYSITGAFLLSDIYDLGTDKLRPPKCKYVLTYGYQLVYGGVVSFWDFDNRETNYTNNDLIMYSDVSNGDLGENVTASNRQLIGDTYDGEITGMVRSKDSLIVFKTRSPYALDGVLIPGQYSMRKIETDDIGCVSSKSILAVDGVVLFQGQDGIYAINGYNCKIFSLPVDRFFRELPANTQSRAVLDTAGNKYLFFCGTSGVMAFDYQYGEWFIWKDISAEKGVTVDNDGNIKMFRTSNVFKQNTTLEDSGAPIDAWIKTAWFNLGEPSALKKATDIRFYALNNVGQTVSLRTYLDWSESKTIPSAITPDYSVDMSSASTKTVLKQLDIAQAQSISFRFRNNVISENLNLTGFEMTMSVWQTKDKNA